MAFAAGRYLRPQSAMASTRREKPPVAVQAIVGLGLAILAAVVGAFVWLLVLGHGF